MTDRTIKLMIKKFKALYPNRNGPGDWGRYYPVEKIVITPGIDFKTEAELAFYMYKKFGEGRFQIISWQKGYEGFWLYWLGNIYENGFVREKGKNKEMEKLKKELAEAKDYDEREMIEEEIDFEKEISMEDKKTKRRGPLGLIKFSIGVMHSYDEQPRMMGVY